MKALVLQVEVRIRSVNYYEVPVTPLCSEPQSRRLMRSAYLEAGSGWPRTSRLQAAAVFVFTKGPQTCERCLMVIGMNSKIFENEPSHTHVLCNYIMVSLDSKYHL